MRLDRREALRYLGARGETEESLACALEAAARAVETQITPAFLFRVDAVVRSAEGAMLRDTRLALPGRTAERVLAGCDQAAIVVCTLGARFDALARQALARGILDAALWDACGSAWVEAGCDAAERAVAARLPGRFLTDRFSPGYGDLPLSVQPALLRAVDAERRLGVTVEASGMMNPQKTVTAVIGLADRPQPARVRGCAHCALRETCAMKGEGC